MAAPTEFSALEMLEDGETNFTISGFLDWLGRANSDPMLHVAADMSRADGVSIMFSVTKRPDNVA